MKKIYSDRFAFGLCVLGIALFLTACDEKGTTNTQQSEVYTDNNVTDFDIDGYREKITDNRLDYHQYREQYAIDTDCVKNEEYRNLSFKNATFYNMPQADSIGVLIGENHGISTQESWDTIRDWLESIGKLDEIDMDNEVRIVNENLGMDDSKETPYSYPALKEHMELDSGAGAVVNTNECHIQISDNGIYSMSDGKIGKYLKTGEHASNDALGTYTQNIVKEGRVEELANDSYQLIDGELTIGQGAELTRQYFEKGTPFTLADGVSLKVWYVKVFKLGDVYGYDYSVQRAYHGIPVAYSDYGNYQVYVNEYNFDEDVKDAYVVDKSGVSAYAGTNDSQILNTVYSTDEIIGVKDATDILSQKMAKFLNVDVQTVSFEYAPVIFSENTKNATYLPAWQFNGVNKTKGEQIRMYVDAFTGDVYYYTFGEE